MASKKTKIVDGFTAIRAAQEAARHGRGDPLRPAGGTSPPAGTSPPNQAGSRIGRSVLPTKREVVCPECYVATEVSGRVALFVCTHCRHRMKLEDVQIPEGEWTGDVEIGGTLIVPDGAVLKSGTITANDVILQGNMAGAELRACRLLTIGKNATVDWVRVKTNDLEIGRGLTLMPGKPVEGRHLKLHGAFSGRAILTGTLTVFADGDFSGQVKAAGLSVEEGGGVRADLDISPDYKPPPPKPRKRPEAKRPSKLRVPPPKASEPQRPPPRPNKKKKDSP